MKNPDRSRKLRYSQSYIDHHAKYMEALVKQGNQASVCGLIEGSSLEESKKCESQYIKEEPRTC